MRRAKLLAAVIYATLIMATMTFVHFPQLQADDPQEHAAQARITAEQAREVALRAVPGIVTDSELERENGRLIYSFEITRPEQRGTSYGTRKRTIVEVNVSALDGSIVNIHRERADKREVKQRAPLNAARASDENAL
jgi:Peptidase propeptide and YPEB domain